MNATLAPRFRPKGPHDLECTVPGWDKGSKKDLERAIKYIREEQPKDNPKGPKLRGESSQTAACVGETKIKWVNDVSIPYLPACPEGTL